MQDKQANNQNGHVLLPCLVASIRQRDDVSVVIDLDSPDWEPIAISAPRESIELEQQSIPPVGGEITALIQAEVVQHEGEYLLVELSDQGTVVRHLIPESALHSQSSSTKT